MVTFPNVVLVLAVVTTALMAGLFYSYSCSVNPGLAKLTDAEYLAAMQSINRAILNLAFFACFFGALVLLPLSTYFNYSHPVTPRFWLLLAATVLYAIGLFGVTIVGNVPLNNMLDSADLSTASTEQLAELRKAFEDPWNRWHAIRTWAVIFSLVLSVIACILPDKNI